MASLFCPAPVLVLLTAAWPADINRWKCWRPEKRLVSTDQDPVKNTAAGQVSFFWSVGHPTLSLPPTATHPHPKYCPETYSLVMEVKIHFQIPFPAPITEIQFSGVPWGKGMAVKEVYVYNADTPGEGKWEVCIQFSLGINVRRCPLPLQNTHTSLNVAYWEFQHLCNIFCSSGSAEIPKAQTSKHACSQLGEQQQVLAGWEHWAIPVH